LQTHSPLWKLRVNCLYYCRFVHGHHGLEDVALFPALRRSDPALGPVVDKLEADHRKVSDHLDEVEAAADALVRLDTFENREGVVNGLRAVAEHLLAHLDYEEQAITPALREWTQWPGH
jgi:hemerythrin-like domain-containing protein